MFINKHLIDFMRGGKQYTFLSCFLEFLWTIVGAIISLLSACAIRIVLSGKPFFVFKYVYQPLIIVVVLLFVQFIVYKQKVSSANKGSRIIKTQIRQDLLNKLFELGSAYTTTSRTGEVANTISNKVEWLSNYYTLYLPASSSSIINAVFNYYWALYNRRRNCEYMPCIVLGYDVLPDVVLQLYERSGN